MQLTSFFLFHILWYNSRALCTTYRLPTAALASLLVGREDATPPRQKQRKLTSCFVMAWTSALAASLLAVGIVYFWRITRAKMVARSPERRGTMLENPRSARRKGILCEAWDACSGLGPRYPSGGFYYDSMVEYKDHIKIEENECHEHDACMMMRKWDGIEEAQDKMSVPLSYWVKKKKKLF